MNTQKIEPVAIIGMACRFPGAPSLGEFWKMLCDGRDGMAPVPAQRWEIESIYDQDGKAPGKINTRTGGFIADVDRFDAAFFGISPREAAQMDPQQRILLELAYEALEDAGVAPATLAGSDTAVYVGAMTNEYMRHQTADAYRRIDVHTGAGAGLCMLANRLSYQFDLRGPSAAVDTACSSSLVAVHQACQSLWTGQSTLALAAGVNVILDPAFNVFYAKAGLSAPDGKCKTFSAAADGIGRAEGAGVIVLKPLQQALADGDPIYAVIRGGAINHDGRSNGLTQPNRWAQEQLLRNAFEHADTDPDELGYIELHGTGTLIGDPIEANALSAVLTAGDKPSKECLVGSVKTNLGHLEAAAGIAGLIKLALSVYHGEIPPSLWFDAPNPHIAFDRMPIRVNTQRVSWPAAKPRVGGISSFGLGGTNAHLVLESAPAANADSRPQFDVNPSGAAEHWLFLSARSPVALKTLATQYLEFLSVAPEADLPAICSTALRRKGVHDFRLNVLAGGKTSLIQNLHAFTAGVDESNLIHGRFRPSPLSLRVALPECQHIDLRQVGRWIVTAPLAREGWNDCRASFARHAEVMLPTAEAVSSFAEVSFGDTGFAAWHFATQYALLKQVIGSVPGVELLVADGLGQLAALCASGVISLDLAVRWLGTGLSTEFVQYESLVNVDYKISCDFASGKNPSPADFDWDRPSRSWRERLTDAADTGEYDVLVLNLSPIEPVAAPAHGEALNAIDGSANGFHRSFARLSLRHNLQWSACVQASAFLRLPTYPWQRESFWLARAPEPIAPIVPKLAVATPVAETSEPPAHALLGSRVDSPTMSWESVLDAKRLPWLPDHRVQNLMVLPGSGYAELGLAVHHAVSGESAGVVEDMEFHKALVIDDDAPPRLRVDFDESSRLYAVYTQRRKGKKWNLHARGALSLVAPAAAAAIDVEAIKKRCGKVIDADAHYQNTRDRGFGYGPYFQGVRRLWIDVSGEEMLAWVEGHEQLTTENHGNRLHPTVFDASLQILLASLTAKGDTELYIPVGIRKLTSYRAAPNGFWVYGKLKQNAGVAEGDVVLFDEQGSVIADARGVRASALTKKNRVDELKQIDQWLYQYAWEEAPSTAPIAQAGSWLVFMDQQGQGKLVAESLKAIGAGESYLVSPGEKFEQLTPLAYTIAPDSKSDMQRIATLAIDAGVTGIAYLWGLDTPSTDDAIAQTHGVLPLAHMIQALAATNNAAPRVIAVTRLAQSALADDGAGEAVQATLTGFMRVAGNEFPGLRLRAIDIDARSETLGTLAIEIASENIEDEIALRGERRLAHRMLRKPVADLNSDPQRRQDIVEADASPVFAPRREPAHDEVELAIRQTSIEAGASAAQFGGAFGVVGTVTAAGKGVKHVSRGNTVFGYRTAKIGAHTTIQGSQALALSKRNAAVATEQAVCLPVFVNAYYLLQQVARLQPRETVLIQNATSPIGLAAIQIARRLGASVYATVTSDTQRAYLESIGVDRVFDQGTLDFVDRIRRQTDGLGVDVVLNTLSGEYAIKSFGLLAEFGRFIELADDEASATSFPVAGGNRALIRASAPQFMSLRPGLFAKILIDVCRGFRARDFVPIPVRQLNAADVPSNVQALQVPEGIGALAVAFDAQSAIGSGCLFTADATYLITGGFGGFGLKIAAWMIEQGARHLVLVGRRAHGPEAQQALAELNRGAARVVGLVADVSKETDVRRVIATLGKDLPPLKGIFHTAAVLDDGPINQLERKQIENVMRPKSLGAWYLHKHTYHLALDYFVLFSSIAAMVGGPGQASYAMSCIYLDALARQRRAQGLAATSINWGALAEVGMTSRYADVEKYLSGSGVGLFTPSQAVALLGRILRWNPVELGVASMDWKQWGSIYPGWVASPKFASLVVHEEKSNTESIEPALLQTLSDLDPTAREQWIADMLCEQLGKTLDVAPEKIDRELSLLSMGLDSLTAMDLQAAVEKRIAVKISMLELMKGNSVMQLAQHIALTFGTPQSSDSATTPAAGTAVRAALDIDDPQRLMAMLGELTDDEVDGLIAKLMPQGEKQ